VTQEREVEQDGIFGLKEVMKRYEKIERRKIEYEERLERKKKRKRIKI
jgi:hypothetical protein